MKLLLTNDDGIDAEGIKVLARTLSAENEVFVVAGVGISEKVKIDENTKTAYIIKVN